MTGPTRPKVASAKPLVSMVKHAGPRNLGASFGDASRLTPEQRGYGWEWRKTRLLILQRDRYVCQCDRCKADGVVRQASQVDHRIPKFEGGTDAHDNLQAISRPCHAIKSAEEAKRARLLGIDLPAHGG